MPKFKFKTARKQEKFHFFTDGTDIISDNINGSHIEIFSNNKIFLEGCMNIIEYEKEYIKLKLKKGCLLIMGNNFVIESFEGENIKICGNVISIEFCV